MSTPAPSARLSARCGAVLLAGALALPSAACTRSEASPAVHPPLARAAHATAPASAPRRDVRLTINDVPITTADVQLQLKSRPGAANGTSEDKAGEDTPGGNKAAEDKASADAEEAVLQSIIREELLAQKAVALGLDADPQLQEDLQAAQAKADAVKRQRLAERFLRSQIADKQGVTEAAARKYFDDHATEIRTELHVLQILERDEAKIQAALNELKLGKPFAEVARQQLGTLPVQDKPWDLGFLSWKQVPEAWRKVANQLEIGQPSGILPGPNQRFWIIQVVERRVNQHKFEDVRDVLVEDLKTTGAAALREQVDRDLLQGARIVRLPRP